MSTFKETYTRLPGRSKQLFAVVPAPKQQLYLAKDHLLVVNPAAYSEQSYRIALADVQAVTTTATLARGIQLFVSVFFLFLLLLFGAYIWFAGLFLAFAPLVILSGIPAFGFFVWMLFNLIQGPTCKTVLRTAVKQHDLTSLRRKRAAQKAAAMIADAVHAQQGGFAPQPSEQPEVYAPPVAPEAPATAPAE